jgi:hypothetical protein
MQSQTVENLPTLIDQGTPVIALESPATERHTFLMQLHGWAVERNLPLYLWNPGYSALQVLHEDALTLKPCHETATNAIDAVVELQGDGIIVLENIPVDRHVHLLHNAVHDLPQRSKKQHWILLSEILEFPSLLIPLVPKLSSPLPRAEALQSWLQSILARSALESTPESLAALTKACLGLPLGELQTVLARAMAQVSSVPELAEQVIAHKISKLRGRGLEFISEPDVPAGGLDLLEGILDRAAALLNPMAKDYGLSFPKGIILWGPPGTGKSLSAKHAAKKMGVPLIAADWGGLISNVPGESESNLRYLLEIVEVTSPCILYWDDFDKAFAGWDSDAGGGVQRRLAGKLLTWLQERTAPVYVIATVNRLEMLPAELNRRFDDIVFVDLPHAGARKAIFDIHLRKYTEAVTGQACEFTDRQWHVLLRDYNLCTAAEIGLSVRKAAEEAFYQGRPGQITVDDLTYQRSQFTPQMIREEEQLLAIRKRATNARPASSPDNSEWRVPPAEMFRFLQGESA